MTNIYVFIVVRGDTIIGRGILLVRWLGGEGYKQIGRGGYNQGVRIRSRIIERV